MVPPDTKRVLLTGMSGVGKSSVVRELRRLGFTALDMDEPGWSIRDSDGDQLWREDLLRAALAARSSGPVFVCGCAENQVALYQDFDDIVLLTAPVDVIRQRLVARTDNPYGKRPEEWAEVLHHLETVEPLLRRRATREIRTTMPLEDVVRAVLALVGAAEPRRAAESSADE